MTAQAQSLIRFSIEGFAAANRDEAMTTARAAGILAAQRADASAPPEADIAFTPDASRGVIAVTATVEGTPLQAMLAVSIAAITLHDLSGDPGAVIETAARAAGAPRASSPTGARRSAGMRDTPRTPAARNVSARPAPRVLMGEVSAPRPPAETGGESREAFRNFMTGRRLRATQWAKDAGVNVGEILGFLTGRNRLSPETRDKLARAARVPPDEMFR